MTDTTADHTPATPAARDPVLRGGELALGVAALGLVSFIGILDLTIVNVILPAIGASYNASPHEVTMAITCFATAQAVATPVTGWLATRFGVIRIFMLSMAGFGVTSLMCGMAPTLELFILARILQGFSAGPLLPVVQTLLQRSVPKPQLPAALAFWAVVMSMAPMAGPILGGSMADSLGWAWGFYINVPFVLLALVVIWRVFGQRETPMLKVRFDYVGLSLLVVWVACLQFVLDKGADNDWFQSGMIVGLTAVAVVGFVAFMIWELTDKHPLIDFSVFRFRSFLIATPVSTISYSSLVISNLMLTLWLQFGMSYTATWAGYGVAVMGATAMLAGPICAWMTRRFDPRLVVSIFMCMSCAGWLWRSTFTSATDFHLVVLSQLSIGFSTTAAMGPIFAMVMGDIPHPKLPGAAGLLTFVRMLVVGVLTAVITTIWTYGQNRAHSDMASALNTESRGLDAFQAGDGLSAQAAMLWNGVINTEAITLSTQNMLLLLAAYHLIAPILIWLCPRPKPMSGPSAAAAD